MGKAKKIGKTTKNPREIVKCPRAVAALELANLESLLKPLMQSLIPLMVKSRNFRDKDIYLLIGT
jgi:hypothetical protein